MVSLTSISEKLLRLFKNVSFWRFYFIMGNLYLQDSPESLQVAALALNDGTQDVTSDNLGKQNSSQDL